jgi:hypothetical protein
MRRLSIQFAARVIRRLVNAVALICVANPNPTPSPSRQSACMRHAGVRRNPIDVLVIERASKSSLRTSTFR